MGRIRSVHPGLFTDEAYMSLSMAAKAALPGLWTECDDAGVFEWKPIVIKAKIFPADNVDMSAILGELQEVNCLRIVEVDGRKYGLIRNFRKWQRPEKPKHRHPLPDDCRSYVGLSPSHQQPITDAPANGSGISPQREEEGGKRKEEGDNTLPSPATISREAEPGSGEKLDLEEILRKAAEWHHVEKRLANTGGIAALIAEGASLEFDVIPTVRALAPRVNSRKSWKYFVPAIREALESRRMSPEPRVERMESQVFVKQGTDAWAAWQDNYRDRGKIGSPVNVAGGWYFPSEFPVSKQSGELA